MPLTATVPAPPAIGEEPVALAPRKVAGLIRRARRVALTVRLDASTRPVAHHGGPVALLEVSKASALRLVRSLYGKGKRVDVSVLFGTLVIG